MKKWTPACAGVTIFCELIILCICLPVAGHAAPEEAHEHLRHGGQSQPAAPPVAQVVADKAEAEDTPGPPQHFGVTPAHDAPIFATLRADRLEWQEVEGEDLLRWDVEGWIGGDYHKLYLESDGEVVIDHEVEEADLELLYSRTIHPFWDLQAGFRHDFKPRPSRSSLALGVQGLAPYWFEVDATAYLSDEGDLSAALEMEYDLLLTQRLILQPRLETGVALQEVEEVDIGSGFTEIELGIRLRYEITRKFAPYAGVSWNRKLGETADLVEADGKEVESTDLVAGVRFWL